jgi:transposase
MATFEMKKREIPFAVKAFRCFCKRMCDKIQQVQSSYGIKEIIFVGDRGMITYANSEKLKDTKGLSTISALTHREIVGLLRRNVIQPGLFDDHSILEVIDPEDITKRYCLCRNPDQTARETGTRQSLIEATRRQLDLIANSKRKAGNDRIAARVGKVLAKTRMGKFVEWKTEAGRLQWSFNEEKIAAEQLLDGCYIITSTVSPERMDKQQVVASYKKLTLVEMAFRNLKTVQLEVRPVYHKTDDRIRCHVFVCMLAYYLQWHMNQRLQPLYESDGENKDRQWTFEHVIERLKSIRRQKLTIAGSLCKIITQPDEEQQRVLDLLKVKL